jgi:hypothetical protein
VPAVRVLDRQAERIGPVATQFGDEQLPLGDPDE